MCLIIEEDGASGGGLPLEVVLYVPSPAFCILWSPSSIPEFRNICGWNRVKSLFPSVPSSDFIVFGTH